MIVRAYAKINLTLDVTGIREDGYHELYTVFQPVSLCDVLTMEPLPEGMEFSCSDPALSGEDNLAARTLRLMLSRYPGRGGARVHLEKRIPVCAGLGGGSADAAAVIRGLDRMLALGMSGEEMRLLGASLGADVPAQLLLCPAVGEGIGDVLTPVGKCAGFPAALFLPAEGLRTAEMYRRLDEAVGRPEGLPAEGARGTALVLEGLREGCMGKIITGAHNVFEKAVPDPAGLLRMKERLLSCGFSAAVMSGSGSAVFCLAEDAGKFREAAARLRASLGPGETLYECEALCAPPSEVEEQNLV